MTNLQIHLLGGLQIRLGDAAPPHFISSKAPALLAYLAVTRRPYHRDALAGLLWGELPDAAAANNLRQALTNLRKVTGAYLHVDRDEIAFDPTTPYFLDVETFTDLLQLHRGQPPAQRIGLLRQALAFYQGEFLAGFHVRDAPDFEEWVLVQRVQLRDLALDGLGTLTQLLIENGQCQEAITTSAQLLALDPWREEAHRWRMLALARCQQRSAALAQYQNCRAILRQEFDAEPDAETTALYHRIRAAQTGPRHNLPAALTGFVGRERELAEVRSLLASPATRLIAIVGPGGAGKTRLAQEIARACEPMFLNGVWFISLPPAATIAPAPAGPEQLAQALAQPLNCPLTGANSAVDQLIAFLRPKEMLLVLENLEEWLEAAAWLSHLLAQAADIKILAPSRQRLNLQAEQVYPLAGLSLSARQEEPLSAPAVQLFLRRARRVQADFAPDAAEVVAAIHICRLVEGLPLGIELAAAWIGQLTCAQIAAEIERSLDFLATDRRDVSPRQRSLRAAFDWSWSRLAAAEQRFFPRLAVFRGPFTRAAAQQVADAAPATMAALADRSLLWRRGEVYQLHEVARQFGLEKLEQAGELAATQARHAHYYAQFLAQQGLALRGRDQQSGLDAIAPQTENIAAAWQWLAAAQDVAGLDAAADGLYHFLAIRSHFRQGAEMFGAARQAVQPLVADGPARLVFARMMAREGRFLSFLSRHAEAKSLLYQALTIARDLGESAEMAFALNHLGGVARLEGDLALATQQIEESLALRRQTGDLNGQAVALLELGGIAFVAAEYATGQAYCQAGLVAAEQAGDQQTAAHLLTGLSLICRELGQYEEAVAFGRRGQVIYETLQDRYGVIQAALTLGELNRRLGKVEEARGFCAQAVQISQEIGHRAGEADGWYRLGQIAADQGEGEEALRQFRLALPLAQEIAETPLALDTLLEIGCLLAADTAAPRARVILHFLDAQPLLSPANRARLAALLTNLGGRGSVPSAQGDLDLPAVVALALAEQ